MTALKGGPDRRVGESVAGEYCGKLPADFGAEAIKVERPGSGSPTRNLRPFVDDAPGTERSGLFAYLNTGKQSLAIDLASPTGAADLQKLVASAHAVIDDHAPAWLAERGLSPATYLDAYPD